jgi:hypothetical protein
MIQLFEAGIVNFVKKKIEDNYGLEMAFIYHPDLNIVSELRKNRFWNSNYTDSSELMKSMLGDYVDTNIAMWNRTPVVKDDSLGGNWYGTELVLKSEDGTETLQEMFMGKSSFSVSFFSSENKILYLLELAYNLDFMLTDLKIPLKYKINGVENEIMYSAKFTNVSTEAFIDVDALGSLRYINFDFEVSGVFFSPFYRTENNKIEEVDLQLFVMDKLLNTSDIENYNESTKACEEICEVKNNYIVEDKCIPSNGTI